MNAPADPATGSEPVEQPADWLDTSSHGWRVTPRWQDGGGET